MTIRQMKKRAKKYALLYNRTIRGLSCGKTLGEHVSSSAANYKVKYEAVMEWLRKHDKEFPK